MILAIIFMGVFLAVAVTMLVKGFKPDAIAFTALFASVFVTSAVGIAGTRIGIANRYPTDVAITHPFDSVSADLSMGYTTNGNIMLIPHGARGLCSDSCRLVILSKCLLRRQGWWSCIDLNHISRTPPERVETKALFYTNRGSPCQP